MRSKQLNETSELVCISSAINQNSISKTKKKSAVVNHPSEAIGMKTNCNYIRKFTPLGRFFGVTKGNPLMKSRDRSIDSYHSV